MSASDPIFRYLRAVSGDFVHNNSSETFLDFDFHLIDEIELYRLCDEQTRSALVSGVLQYYESNNENGFGLQYIPNPQEAFNKMCSFPLVRDENGNLFRTRIFDVVGVSGVSVETKEVSAGRVTFELGVSGGGGGSDTDTHIDVEFDSVPIAQNIDVLNFKGDAIEAVSADATGKIVTVCVSGGGSVSGFTKQEQFTLSFLNNGNNVKNKWLDYEGANVFGFDTPGLLPQDCILDTVTFSNRDDGVSIDIEIWTGYLGSEALLKKFELRGCRYFISSSVENENLIIPRGVPVRLFMRDAGNPAPAKCVVELHFTSIAVVNEELCIPSDPPPP